jgi:hypothetical protein
MIVGLGGHPADAGVYSGEIAVEEYAFFGHGVAILTGTHRVSSRRD